MRSGEGASRTSALCTPWAEASTGTTGVGTALVARGPVAVRRFEHWCAAFHDWSCAAARCDAPTAARSGSSGSPCGDGPFPSTRRVARGCGVGCRAAAARRAAALARRTTSRPRSPRPSSPAASRASAQGGRSSCRSTQHVVELEHGLVWLGTSEGRVRAAARGLDALEARLAPAGFLRVSRTAIVNLHRVREIAPSFKGGGGW